MTDYETAYRALREGVEALADEWEQGIPCDCGHSLDTHNGYGCYERLSYEPLVKCDCALTDDRHDGQLAATILRALLAPSPAEGTGQVAPTEVASLKHARDCSDIRRFGECHLPFDEQGQHVPAQSHSPEKVLTSGSFQFVQCACSSTFRPSTHVWVREHFTGNADDGWRALEDVVRRQGGILPIHNHPTPAPVSSGEAGAVERLFCPKNLVWAGVRDGKCSACGLTLPTGRRCEQGDPWDDTRRCGTAHRPAPVVTPSAEDGQP